MNKYIDKKTMEHPKAIQIVAAVLMTKPLLDLILAQAIQTSSHDWLSGIFIFFAGVALLVRHKTSWVFAILLCISFILTTTFTIVHELQSSDTTIAYAKIIDCIIVLFVVGTVAYFFRYPYLDRRQSWFGQTAHRHAISTTIILNNQTTSTIDISYSGARIKRLSGQDFIKGEKVPFELSEINNIKGTAEVIDVHADNIHIQFLTLSEVNRQNLQKWLIEIAPQHSTTQKSEAT